MRPHHFGFLVSVLVFLLGQFCVGQSAAASPELGPGIVAEGVEKGSVAEKVGLKEGDVLLSWSRGEDKGTFESPFDLSEVNIEERPRGNVTIQGLRGTEKHIWVLGPEWVRNPDGVARPNFSPNALRAYNSAEELLRAGTVPEARKRWVEIAVRNARAGWLYPWLLIHRINLLVDAHRWTEADQLLDEASRKAPLAGSEVAAAVHRWWAFACWARGDTVRARNHYQQALEIDLQGGSNTLAVARDFVNLARDTQQDPKMAKSYLEQATSIQEQLAPDSLDLAYTFTLAGYFADAKDLNQAEKYFGRALDIQEKLSPGGSDSAFALINLGAISLERDDSMRAESYYRRALELERTLNPHGRHLALALDGLAMVALLRNRLPAAEYYALEALAIQRNLAGSGMDVAQSLASLSCAAYRNHELQKAEAYARHALSVAERLWPRTLLTVSFLSNLGEARLARGDTRGAQHYFRRALTIERRLAPDGLQAAGTFEDLGDVYRKTRRFARAEESYRKALAIWERIEPGTSPVAETETDLAQVERHQRRFDEAARLYEQALDVLEKVILRVGDGTDGRTGFRARYQDPYREYVDLLVQQRQPERAFQVLERSRGRGLVEMLSTGHIDVHKGVDSGLLEQERTLQRNLTGKSNQRIRLVSGEYTEDQLRTLDNEITDLLVQQQDLEAQIRSSSPGYAALTQPQPLSAREVQQQLLDQDTALLEYSLGEERSYLFLLTPTTLNSYELPSRKRIERAARRVYTLLTARNHAVRGEAKRQRQARIRLTAQAYQRAVGVLSRMILQSAAGEFQSKRLLIVTDGALAYIPFAAVPLPGSSVPLMAHHEIVYLPSASALAVFRQQEQRRKQPSRAVAVLADPVFSEDDPRVIRSLPGREVLATNSSPRAVAPQDYDSFEADLPAHLLQRSIGDVKPSGRLRLNRLPYTRQEAQAIASSVPTGQGLQALDFQASRSTATGPDLAQYRIVHFATHGLLDSRRPELSGLVLSLVDEHGQAQNGFLELQDIYNLNLSADLVVLSACETALGKEVDGEGLVGLTRGFMYAGASRVMASLWRVDDEATAELMKKFYAGILQEGKTPAAALGEAQRWMRGQTKWREPYYWAGFVLQGEWK